MLCTIVRKATVWRLVHNILHNNKDLCLSRVGVLNHFIIYLRLPNVTPTPQWFPNCVVRCSRGAWHAHRGSQHGLFPGSLLLGKGFPTISCDGTTTTGCRGKFWNLCDIPITVEILLLFLLLHTSMTSKVIISCVFTLMAQS